VGALADDDAAGCAEDLVYPVGDGGCRDSRDQRLLLSTDAEYPD
jgi:hypothetical protein